MKKLEAMTAAQEAAMLAFREEYLQIGLCTEPADRPRAEKAIAAIYQRVGKPTPYFWWTPSPAVAMLVPIVVKDLRANLGDNLRANLGDNLWANLWANLRANLRANLWANLWANLGDNLRANLWANLWANLGDNLGDNLRANLGDNLGDNLRANLRADLWDNLTWTYLWGQHDAYWIAYYLFPHRHLRPMYSGDDLAKLMLWDEIARSCGWWWPFSKVCIISERHRSVVKDERGRLHNLTGPALRFEDDYSVYAIHGVRVSADIVEHPERITGPRILAEENAEVRRVMIERIGFKAFLDQVQATEIDRDPDPHWGTLYEVPNVPVRFVRMRNCTPEPDGSWKDYVIAVARECQTAKEAIIRSWGLEPKTFGELEQRHGFARS